MVSLVEAVEDVVDAAEDITEAEDEVVRREIKTIKKAPTRTLLPDNHVNHVSNVSNVSNVNLVSHVSHVSPASNEKIVSQETTKLETTHMGVIDAAAITMTDRIDKVIKSMRARTKTKLLLTAVKVDEDTTTSKEFNRERVKNREFSQDMIKTNQEVEEATVEAKEISIHPLKKATQTKRKMPTEMTKTIRTTTEITKTAITTSNVVVEDVDIEETTEDTTTTTTVEEMPTQEEAEVTEVANLTRPLTPCDHDL